MQQAGANTDRMANKNKPAPKSVAQTRPPRPLFPMIAIGVLIVAAAAFMIFGRASAPSTVAASAASPTTPAATGPTPQPFYGKYYPSQGHAHLDPAAPNDFVYNSNPPTSGPHREVFSDTFLSPTPLPAYVQVHLLEHGNVLLQYNCKCPDIVNALNSIAMTYDSKQIPSDHLQPTAQDVQNAEEQGMAVLVAPYPQMKSKIALSAWTRLAVLNSVDTDKIKSFIGSFLTNSTNASQ